MLSEWRKQENPLLQQVIDAIECKPINNKRLAAELKTKWNKVGYGESLSFLTSLQNQDTLGGGYLLDYDTSIHCIQLILSHTVKPEKPVPKK